MNTNALAFTALCNEYCGLLTQVAAISTADLADRLLRMLPRIYICAMDLSAENALAGDEDGWLEQALTEDEYESLRNMLSASFGEHDVYLEVFEEDMKYSDTPVAASISENLSDIYQALYDFLNTVRYGSDTVVDEAILSVKASFKEYWSATLCNVLRALNHLWSQGLLFSEDEQERD